MASKELSKAWEHYKNTPDVSHGTQHIQSVLDNSLELAKAYPHVNREDIEYAAVLHDITREDDFKNGTNTHQHSGQTVAMDYIKHLDRGRRSAIMDAIGNHRSPSIPTTDLGKIIADADRISNVGSLPSRSYGYSREHLGLDPASSARSAYWRFRHGRLKRRNTLASGLHTEAGRNLYTEKIKDMNEQTNTFKGFLSLIPEAPQDIEFKTASVESVGAFHFSNKDHKPGNILDAPMKTQFKILGANEAGVEKIEKRHTVEALMRETATKKLGLKDALEHPLYFKLGPEKPKSWKNSKGYTIDPALLEKATFLKGDSIQQFNKILSNSPTYSKVKDELAKRVLTKDEANTLSNKTLKSPLPSGKGVENYMEGHIWEPYKVEGDTIVPKTATKEASIESLSKRVKDFLHLSRSEKIDTISDESNGNSGIVSASFTKKAMNTDAPFKDLRRDYCIANAPDNDPLKLRDYRRANERLLSKFKLAPNVANFLQSEADWAGGIADKADAAGQMELQQQAVALKGTEIALKDQEANIGRQNKLTDATVKNMNSQASRAENEGRALVTSAKKGVPLPASAPAQPSMGIPAGPQDPSTQQQGTPTNGDGTNQPPQGQFPKGEAPQGDGEEQPQQGQATQGQATQGQSPKQKKPIKTAFETNVVLGKAKDALVNFGKNLAGRQNELRAMEREIGKHEGLGASAFNAGSEFHTQVNAEAAEALRKKMQATDRTVRKTRVDTAIGAAGAGLAYNMLKTPSNNYDAYGYKTASDSTIPGMTTLSIPRSPFYKDIGHALKTLPDGIATKQKKRVLLSAAGGLAAAGLALYGAHKLPTEYQTLPQTNAEMLNMLKEFGEDTAYALVDAARFGSPYIASGGGAYYAKQNWDNKKKRNIGLGVSALGTAMVAKDLANKDYGLSAPLPYGEGTHTGWDAVPYSAGLWGVLGGMGAVGHNAQRMREEERKHELMHGNLPVNEVATELNAIKNHNSFVSKYPALRHVMGALPGPVRAITDRGFGRPAATFDPEDQAYYFQAQVEKEYQNLVKRYEATQGHPTQEADTDLKGIAHDIVTKRLGIL